MLSAKVIMFSRSLTKDYRWIYSGDFINEKDKSYILNDYKIFEKDKEIFLREQHLVIRQFKDKIVVYKFLETKDKDLNSRKIYALMGCIFSEFDFEIFQSLYKYIVSYLYIEFDTLFEKYQSNIPENKEELIEKIEFSLDSIMEYFRDNNMKLLVSAVFNFANQNLTNNFIIKNNIISQIECEKNILFPTNQRNINTISRDININSTQFKSEMINNDLKKQNEYKIDSNDIKKTEKVVQANNFAENLRKISMTQEKKVSNSQSNGLLLSRNQSEMVDNIEKKTEGRKGLNNLKPTNEIAQKDDGRKSLESKKNGMFSNLLHRRSHDTTENTSKD